jgi:hypothetical protein
VQKSKLTWRRENQPGPEIRRTRNQIATENARNEGQRRATTDRRTASLERACRTQDSSGDVPSLSVMSHMSPTHHEINKYNSLHETRIKIKLPKHHRFKFKPRHINDLSQSNQGTDHLISQEATWSTIHVIHMTPEQHERIEVPVMLSK